MSLQRSLQLIKKYWTGRFKAFNAKTNQQHEPSQAIIQPFNLQKGSCNQHEKYDVRLIVLEKVSLPQHVWV